VKFTPEGNVEISFIVFCLSKINCSLLKEATTFLDGQNKFKKKIKIKHVIFSSFSRPQQKMVLINNRKPGANPIK